MTVKAFLDRIDRIGIMSILVILSNIIIGRNYYSSVLFYTGGDLMGVYREIYEFAARAGAFEGFVYAKDKVEPGSLKNWVSGLTNQHRALPNEVRSDFQDLCDGTLGRAIQSLIPHVGEDHELIQQLKSLVQGKLPSSPDDFSRGK